MVEAKFYRELCPCEASRVRCVVDRKVDVFGTLEPKLLVMHCLFWAKPHPHCQTQGGETEGGRAPSRAQGVCLVEMALKEGAEAGFMLCTVSLESSERWICEQLEQPRQGSLVVFLLLSPFSLFTFSF